MDIHLTFSDTDYQEACLSIASILRLEPHSTIWCEGDFSPNTTEELMHFEWVCPGAKISCTTEAPPSSAYKVPAGSIATGKTSSDAPDFCLLGGKNYEKHKKNISRFWDGWKKKKARIALIIDEYFGGAGTAFGGYGFVARCLVGKFLPNRHVELEVILGRGRKAFKCTEHCIDGIKVYYLPKWRFCAARVLKRKKYDAYLSIELVSTFALRLVPAHMRKLLLWIQDPRPTTDWDEINTVQIFKEFNYWNPEIYNFVHKLYQQGQVRFITQAPYLVPKARTLYELPDSVDAPWVPNPVEVDESFSFDLQRKENMIIYLGRLESVKRGWLFCEIARRLPQYQFYVLGKYHRDSLRNKELMQQYETIPNLHFVGHVEGKEKEQYLKRARLIINTSIHEALPVSFLEALAYGTCIVSNQNPEGLAKRFGAWTGQILGDGFDKVECFLSPIQELMENDDLYAAKAQQGMAYIRNHHRIEPCMKLLRNALKETIQAPSL